MSITTARGQWLQGQPQKIKLPNKQKQVLFDNDMPSISPDFKYSGHTPKRQGAYLSGKDRYS